MCTYCDILDPYEKVPVMSSNYSGEGEMKIYLGSKELPPSINIFGGNKQFDFPINYCPMCAKQLNINPINTPTIIKRSKLESLIRKLIFKLDRTYHHQLQRKELNERWMC
jgi:hypothetical protein